MIAYIITLVVIVVILIYGIFKNFPLVITFLGVQR